MLVDQIVKFSRLCERIAPLIEEAGFKVAAVGEYAMFSPVTGQPVGRVTGDFTIRIIPAGEESSQKSS
jgi:hypothetical protein